MRNRYLAAPVAVAFAMFLMLPAVGLAQVSTASINGTVIDAQRAVIIGAQLTLTNVETNVEQRTVTNEAGLYRFQNLVIGRYTLAA